MANVKTKQTLEDPFSLLKDLSTAEQARKCTELNRNAYADTSYKNFIEQIIKNIRSSIKDGCFRCIVDIPLSISCLSRKDENSFKKKGYTIKYGQKKSIEIGIIGEVIIISWGEQ